MQSCFTHFNVKVVSMKIKKFAVAGIAALAALTLAACSGAPAANNSGSGNGDTPAVEGTIKLRVQSQASIASEPLYLGIEQGFFEEEGLEIEVVELPDVTAAIAALQAGKLELAFTPTMTVLQTARQNIPITMIAPSDGINPLAAEASIEEARNYTSVGVYVSKGSGITDIEGLAGASIAVPELKGQPDGTITSVLHENGIETDGIEWLNLGFVPAVAALKDDQIDAAFLVSPFSMEADAAGLLRVMNPSVEFFPKGSATTAWTASQSWAENNPEAVARFQRAIKKSAAWTNDNLDKAKQHVIDRSGVKISIEDMPQSWWPETLDPVQLQEVNDKLEAIGFYTTPLDVTTILTPFKG